MKTLDIDLVSDVVCPWCAIGVARLEQALGQLDDVEARLRWHPFVLNPDLPAEGRDMVDHLAAKYGKTPDQIHASQQQIIAAAHELGLHFERAAELRDRISAVRHVLERQKVVSPNGTETLRMTLKTPATARSGSSNFGIALT